MILVIGGTGHVGRHLQAHLAHAGTPARFLVRSPQRAEEVRAAGFAPAPGDLTDVTTIDQALDGIQRLFLLTPVGADDGAIKTAIIDRARKAGVSHVVLLSGAGGDPRSRMTIMRQAAQAETHLLTSGLEFTILKPVFYMQNLLDQATTIKTTGAFYGNYQRGAIAMVDTRDVAAVATACLTEPGHDGRTYLITGQQAITGPAAAAEFSSALGRPVAYVDLPSGQLINAMISTGTPPWLASDLAMLGEDYAAGKFTQTTDTVQMVTRKHPATFGEFITGEASSFS